MEILVVGPEFHWKMLAHICNLMIHSLKHPQNLKWLICIFSRVATLPDSPCSNQKTNRITHLQALLKDPQLQAQKHTATSVQ